MRKTELLPGEKMKKKGHKSGQNSRQGKVKPKADTTIGI